MGSLKEKILNSLLENVDEIIEIQEKYNDIIYDENIKKYIADVYFSKIANLVDLHLYQAIKYYITTHIEKNNADDKVNVSIVNNYNKDEKVINFIITYLRGIIRKEINNPKITIGKYEDIDEYINVELLDSLENIGCLDDIKEFVYNYIKNVIFNNCVILNIGVIMDVIRNVIYNESEYIKNNI